MPSILEFFVDLHGKGSVFLDGQELKNCKSIDFHSEAGKPCLVTLKVFANIKGRAAIPELTTLSNETIDAPRN